MSVCGTFILRTARIYSSKFFLYPAVNKMKYQTNLRIVDDEIFYLSLFQNMVWNVTRQTMKQRTQEKHQIEKS
jgi:hypothetical protein